MSLVTFPCFDTHCHLWYLDIIDVCYCTVTKGGICWYQLEELPCHSAVSASHCKDSLGTPVTTFLEACSDHEFECTLGQTRYKPFPCITRSTLKCARHMGSGIPEAMAWQSLPPYHMHYNALLLVCTLSTIKHVHRMEVTDRHQFNWWVNATPGQIVPGAHGMWNML